MSDATNLRLLRSRRDEVRERYHANPRLLYHLVQVGVGARAVEALRGPDAAAPVKRSVLPQFELAEGRIYPMPTGSPAYAREAVLATSESDEDHAEVRRCYEAKNAIQEAGMPLLETLVPGVTAAYRACDIFLGPWMDFVYRIGSDQPRSVSYRVECHVEDHDEDREHSHGGYIELEELREWSRYIEFEDLREWSMGDVALRPGIYSLWLSRDIRICMLDALDLILAEDDFGRRPLANGLVNEGPPSPSRTPVAITHEFGAVKLDEVAASAAKPPGYWIKASERDLVKFDLLEPPRAGYLEAQEAAGLIEVQRINGKPSRIHINDPNRHEEFRDWPKGKRGRRPRNS